MAIKPSEKSLSNLEKIESSEMANEYRLRGLETRRKNKEQRELAKHTIMAMKSICLLYTSPSPRDRTRSRMPSSA